MTRNPFAVLGLPAQPDLSDEDVRAAWRRIASATHPDREDGGDPALYAEASNAYTILRTPWGRSEAYADLRVGITPNLAPPATVPAGARLSPWRAVVLVPARVRHGRPARLVLRIGEFLRQRVNLDLLLLDLFLNRPVANRFDSFDRLDMHAQEVGLVLLGRIAGRRGGRRRGGRAFLRHGRQAGEQRRPRDDETDRDSTVDVHGFS